MNFLILDENQGNERVQINEIHKIKMEIPCYRVKY